MRRLEVTNSGRWYLALTILLGVVALTSGNNVLFLIESLLLSGLILSGVLSERTVSGLKIEIRRRRCRAGEPTGDQIHLTNRKNYPLFCVEIGEWVDKEFVPLAWIPKLSPHERVSVKSRQVIPARGVHRWEALAIGTSYPFGFARKIKLIGDPGQRLIWPSRQKTDSQAAKTAQTKKNEGQGRSTALARSGTTVVEGEARPINQDDDHRMLIWTLSAKGQGNFVRPRRAHTDSSLLLLDLRQEAGASFESQVMGVARELYRQIPQDREGEIRENASTLTLVDWGGQKRVIGLAKALDALALIQASGDKKDAA